MMRRVLTITLPALTILGCTSAHGQHNNATGTGTPTPTPFSLYTHCGISETRIGATYYVAEKPLDDDQGNPPAGWDNPYQQGTITITSATTAVFRDNKGHRVIFRSRSGATAYMHVCS